MNNRRIRILREEKTGNRHDAEWNRLVKQMIECSSNATTTPFMGFRRLDNKLTGRTLDIDIPSEPITLKGYWDIEVEEGALS